MTFKTIHTTYGLQRMAQAEATGVPINLVEMAVGDGNGNSATPSEGQTNLVRERFRAAVNRVYQDPDNPNLFVAELIIPASVGGFVIRECAAFDDHGSMFVVANTPDTYKPNVSEGAFSDTVMRMVFMVSNASVVTLMIDPNVAVASHTWVINNVTPASLLPGGNTNQFLAKKSNADGDVEWRNPTDVNVVVNTIEETQTLAASQTVVDLVTTTTIGLALYVDSDNNGSAERLRRDQWTAHPTINTRLTLTAAFPAGSRLIAVQNEPAGLLPDPLVKGQNLADVPDKAVGRTNLGVYSKEETDTKAPPGMIGHFARDSAPAGWWKANGAAISRTAYAALFAAIGTRFGAGDGFTTFNLPDLRGEFIRSWDDGRGVDSGRALGGGQGSQNLFHAHGASTSAAGYHNHGGATGPGGAHSHSYETAPPASWPDGQGAADGASWLDLTQYSTRSTSTVGDHAHGIASDGSHAHAVTVNGDGGNEARPRNVSMLACIKF